MTNTERRPVAYIKVREDASTGFSLQMPLKTPFPFGIYIHWPYCLSKCPYCDFFSTVKKDVEQETLIEEYIKDLDFYFEMTSSRTVTSIFFGGGTPSLIKPELISKLIDHIGHKWKMADKVEVSLEANPNTDRPHLFSDLKSAGINRLSLGVQALNEKDLKTLGRTHSLKEAYQSIDEVLKTFDNHSMDLIYARPEQTLKNWSSEISQATALGFKHLSMYQLTIEEGTIFYKKGLLEANEEIAEELYAFTNDFLASKGYLQYEISNYAQTGFESSHNQIYWTGDDYLGIGASAHGRIKSLGKIYATTHPRKLEELTPQERAEELIIMGLRLNQGIDKSVFKQNCGLDFEVFINQERLQNLLTEKLIINSPKKIIATNQGRLLLNKLIEELCF